MRSTLAMLGAALTLAWWTGPVVAGSDGERAAVENASYRVEVELARGTIVRIHDRRGGLELIGEPRLADNFRFTLPLRGPTAWQSTEANVVLGKDQRLTSHRKEENALVLRWEGPLRNEGGHPYDVAAEMAIRLVGEEVRCEFRIENHTQHEIGEVFAPVLGGCIGLGESATDRKQTRLEVPARAGVQTSAIFQRFANHSWLGVIGPEQYYGYPDTLVMPWVELTQPRLNRGFSIAAHDSLARYKVMHLEMVPGTAGDRAGGNWPRSEELGGQPAGVKLAVVHMPYQPAGQTFEASPVVLRAHEGNWKDAARLYGEWFRSRFGLADATPAASQAGAFQECHGVPFRDLPAWAQAGARCGVRELVLTGWAAGDADGVPRFEPAPALGTRDDLARAIARCRELGVDVTLDLQLQPVAMDQPWYAKELERYACRDRWGIVWTTMGWGHGGTIVQQLGSTERRALLNPGTPGFRQVLARQLRPLADLGVAGVRLHDFAGKALDFNPATMTTPDRASWEGLLACLTEIRKACETPGHRFTVDTDPVWDRVLPLSLTTRAELGEPSALRAAFPAIRSTFSVTEPDDITTVNESVRLGGRLRIAPVNGQPMGGPEMADLARYVATVMATRVALGGTLVEGTPQAASGIHAEGDMRIGVFRAAKTGLMTVVVVNPRGRAASVRLSGLPSTPATLWRPAAGACPFDPGTPLSLAPDELALITEEPAALQRLNGIPRWVPPGGGRARQVVFELRSEGDLQGWSFEGSAFHLAPMPPLFRSPTLNSLAAGEGGVGTARSPQFTVGPEYGEIELLMQGGTSSKESGEENLALRIVDARTGATLAQMLPPSTHVLVTMRLRTAGLTGRPLRIELLDRNRASSYAWIGLRRVALLGKVP